MKLERVPSASGGDLGVAGRGRGGDVVVEPEVARGGDVDVADRRVVGRAHPQHVHLARRADQVHPGPRVGVGVVELLLHTL